MSSGKVVEGKIHQMEKEYLFCELLYSTGNKVRGTFGRRPRLSEEESSYKSYDDLPLFLNSATVAKVLGVSPSSGYELMHEPGFPVLRIGNRMVVPKEQFIQWVKEHTGGGT